MTNVEIIERLPCLNTNRGGTQSPQIDQQLRSTTDIGPIHNQTPISSIINNELLLYYIHLALQMNRILNKKLTKKVEMQIILTTNICKGTNIFTFQSVPDIFHFKIIIFFDIHNVKLFL